MSFYMEYKMGDISYDEYMRECARENAEDRYYRSREGLEEYYTDDPDDPYWDDEEDT